MSAIDRAQADSDKKKKKGGRVASRVTPPMKASKKKYAEPTITDENELEACRLTIRDRVCLSAQEMVKEVDGLTFLGHLLAYRKEQRAKHKKPRFSDKYLSDLKARFRASAVTDAIDDSGRDKVV